MGPSLTMLSLVVIVAAFSAGKAAGKCSVDDESTKYVVAFLENVKPFGLCDVYITAKEKNVNVQVTTDTGVKLHTTLNFSETKKLIFQPNITRTKNGLERKGILVESSGLLTVQAANMRISSADVYHGSHITEDATKFVIPCHITGYSRYTIVSVDNNTVVQLFSKKSGYEMIKRLTLNKYDTYTVKKKNCSGDRVVSDRPVAVVAGQRCGNVPAGVSACDHMATEVPPVQSLGTLHYIPPIADRPQQTGYIIQVMAGWEPLTVETTFSGSRSLEAGGFWELDVTGAGTVNCSAPCMVIQYNKGAEADGKRTDPFMLIITPVNNFRHFDSWHTARAPKGESLQNYLAVVAPTGHYDRVLLDGKNMPEISWFPFPGGQYSYSNATYLKSGMHTLAFLSRDLGLAGYVHGHGTIKSNAVGYPTGTKDLDAPPLEKAQCVDNRNRFYASSVWNTNHGRLALDGDNDTCMTTGYESTPWLTIVFMKVQRFTAVNILGRFNGTVKVQIGGATEEIGHMMPPVGSSAYCGNAPLYGSDTRWRNVTCLKPTDGRSLYLMGTAEEFDQMTVCEVIVV